MKKKRREKKREKKGRRVWRKEGRKGREKEKGEREGRERVKKGSEQVLTCEHNVSGNRIEKEDIGVKVWLKGDKGVRR